MMVAHVMRTYGVHGGEHQLGQLFSSFNDDAFQHAFFFVYRDEKCANHFQQTGRLTCRTLLPLRSRVFPGLIVELATLVLLLPFLQLRMLFLLRKLDCQICVAHGVQGALVSWLAACLLRDRKFVYVHRGTKSKRGQHPVFKLLYRPFDVVAGVSQASAESLKSLVEGRKLHILENGIDLQRVDRGRDIGQTKKHDSLVISCVGRLLPGKGQRLLLEAFKLFVNAYPNCELWLVGDGPDSAELKRLATGLAFASKVKFLGHCSQVIGILLQTDVFVYASESEGLSNAVLEAMAVGLPSVVVDAPGVSECHVDGSTGFVTARSAKRVAEKMLVLANDPALRARMGDQARHRVVEHYSIEANWRRYAALYLQLTSQQ